MLNACENARHATRNGDDMSVKIWLAALPLLALAGCTTIEELWRGGPRELSRVRPDVTQLACEGGRTLSVRIEPGSKSAWIILPDREFRLDAVAGGYSNGRSMLAVKGDVMSLEDPGSPSLAGCKRPATG
jgi:hypothetical protein